MKSDRPCPAAVAALQTNQLLGIASRIMRTAGWMYEIATQAIIWSDEMCAMHGVPPGTSPSIAEMFDFAPPEYHELMRAGIDRCIRHGVRFDQELQILPIGGECIWVRVLCEAVRDANGRTLRLEGALQDISTTKAFEHQLRQNEQRFINVAHATTDAVWDWDLIANTIWWNDGIQTVFGFAEDEVARDDSAWLRRLHPDDRPRVQQKIVDAIKGASNHWSDEYRSIRRDGSYAFVSDHALLIRDDDRRVVRMVGGITDLSSRMQLEFDLQRLNRALRLLTACNELLIRANDEHDLLTAVCELIISVGGYQMAYVGFAMDDKERTILPVAHAGDESYLTNLQLSWSEHAPFGRGPAGRTIRSGAASFINDIANDPIFGPWRENAIRHGFKAVISLPLRQNERTFGLLGLFSDKVLAVGTEEINLLQQMANDIAFGIDNLRAQALQRLADARIREQASLLDNAQDAIVVSGPDHRVRFWNKGAERLYGFSADEAIGLATQDLLYANADAFLTAADKLMKHGEWTGELVQRRKDGTLLTAECRWTRVKDEVTQSPSILAINTDISERKAAAREIEKLAFYDQLTGLPNRQLLVERVRHSQARIARSGLIGAVLFIDLDNFKTLNDTLGHAMGDRLLQVVSARLLECVREHDTVARFGGDEFVISLIDLDADAEAARCKAILVGDKILETMRLPIRLGESHDHHGSCSIGITLLDKGEDTIDDLLKRADLAMYRAKASGRNTLQVFAPDMQVAVNVRAESEIDLRRAILQSEFLLHYQPQLDQAGVVIGAEALVRWQHPVRGLVSPLEFIFLAEETGQIHALGKWVLESACAQLARWTAGAANFPAATKRTLATLTVAVNVSVQQFRHPDFVDLVLHAVNANAIDPRRLKLELTESLLVDDVEATIAKMLLLKAKGIDFALDDFGTGYSSLSYLKRLPLSQLKIDQSFVRDVLTDPNDAAIARTIVALAQSLGLSVIAEGVETLAQRDFLAQHGCTTYQGYLFSRPLSVTAFEAFVQSTTRVSATA